MEAYPEIEYALVSVSRETQSGALRFTIESRRLLTFGSGYSVIENCSQLKEFLGI